MNDFGMQFAPAQAPGRKCNYCGERFTPLEPSKYLLCGNCLSWLKDNLKEVIQ
ncbi:MAG TPA: hypothetical protein VJI67_00950 [archaeon]|nr:hypothetical protein [archaeon]HLD80861.1 hypothetical protein [archaeon]